MSTISPSRPLPRYFESEQAARRPVIEDIFRYSNGSSDIRLDKGWVPAVAERAGGGECITRYFVPVAGSSLHNPGGTASTASRLCYIRLRASCIDMGMAIMLTLALCITHSDPATTMAISNVVQMKMPVFCRWLLAAPMCRK